MRSSAYYDCWEGKEPKLGSNLGGDPPWFCQGFLWHEFPGHGHVDFRQKTEEILFIRENLEEVDLTPEGLTFGDGLQVHPTNDSHTALLTEELGLCIWWLDVTVPCARPLLHLDRFHGDDHGLWSLHVARRDGGFQIRHEGGVVSVDDDGCIRLDWPEVST